MKLLAASTPLEALGAAVAVVLGVVITTVFQQRNRKSDKREAREVTSLSARQADTEAALKAWDQINKFQADQIADLQAQVVELRKRVDTYEDALIPSLQKTITEKQGTINAQQTTIASLLKQIGEMQSGGSSP